MIDIHSHILPGLDDGAGDLQEALEMARLAVADGIRVMVASPHLCKQNSIGLVAMLVSTVAALSTFIPRPRTFMILRTGSNRSSG